MRKLVFVTMFCFCLLGVSYGQKDGKPSPEPKPPGESRPPKGDIKPERPETPCPKPEKVPYQKP